MENISTLEGSNQNQNLNQNLNRKLLELLSPSDWTTNSTNATPIYGHISGIGPIILHLMKTQANVTELFNGGI